MTIEEIAKEIVEIIEYRNKYREQHNYSCSWIERKYSLARLKRLRLMLNELIKREEYQ